MHEAELANMTQRQLVETLSALLLEYEQDPWTIEDAALMAEIRDELAYRYYSTRLLDELRLARSHRRLRTKDHERLIVDRTLSSPRVSGRSRPRFGPSASMSRG